MSVTGNPQGKQVNNLGEHDLLLEIKMINNVYQVPSSIGKWENLFFFWDGQVIKTSIFRLYAIRPNTPQVIR